MRIKEMFWRVIAKFILSDNERTSPNNRVFFCFDESLILDHIPHTTNGVDHFQVADFNFRT